MKTSLVSREVIADSIELVARGHLFDARDRALRLRQDDPRHRHGAGPPRRPGRDALRRLDLPGPLPGPRRHHPGRLRGRRRPRRRQDDRRGARRSSRTSPAPAPAPAAASSPPTPWPWPSRSWASRPSVAAMRPRAERRQGRGGQGRRAPGRRRPAPRPAAARRSSPGQRSRTPSPPSPPPAARPTRVLHLLALAHEAGVDLDIDDFDRISRADPAAVPTSSPAGEYVAADLYDGRRHPARRPAPARGRPAPRRRARPSPAARSASTPPRPRRPPGQEVVRPLDDPIKPTGGLAILRGNLAPEGCVVKLAGHERTPPQPARRASSSPRRTRWPPSRPSRSSRRRRRHPQRGPRRRPRHARDARGHRRDRRRGPRRGRWRCSPTAASPAPPTA